MPSSPSPSPPSQSFRISTSYLIAVALIFGITSAAWLFLGRVTDRRTRDRDQALRKQVGQLWGGQHRQIAPELQLKAITAARAPRPRKMSPQTTEAPATGPIRDWAAAEPPRAPAPAQTLTPLSTRAKASIELEHRRKGLLWYNTYAVSFEGRYRFENATGRARAAQLTVPMPAQQAVYDDFVVEVDGERKPVTFTRGRQRAAELALTVPDKGAVNVTVRYRSRGLDRWAYLFGRTTARAPDFQLTVKTNFEQVDFPAGALSPTTKRPAGDGWLLTWRFANLLSDSSIAVTMPRKINPGPLTAQIARFAPVSLLFFFGVLLLVAVLRQVRLHPVHFAMLAGAFFSFHLLLAYLVDLVPLPLALGIASTTSVALVVSYLRLAVGGRFALSWAGGAQLLYLVLFSLAFCWEGYTGLTITVFSVLTLFVAMQLTARIDWFSKLGGSSREGPTAGAPTSPPPAEPAPLVAPMDVQDAFQRVR